MKRASLFFGLFASALVLSPSAHANKIFSLVASSATCAPGATGRVTVAPSGRGDRMHVEISGLPVLDGTHVVGVITESDIFRLVVKAWSEA
jgi:CBS domain-containing protein